MLSNTWKASRSLCVLHLRALTTELGHLLLTSEPYPDQDPNRCFFFGTPACSQHWLSGEAHRVHTHSSLDLCSMATLQQGHPSPAVKRTCKLFCRLLRAVLSLLNHAKLFTVPPFTLGSTLKLFTTNFALILSLSAQIGWETVLRKRHFVTILLLFYLCTFSPSARLVFTPAIFL